MLIVSLQGLKRRQRYDAGRQSFRCVVPLAGHQGAGWATALGGQTSRGPSDTNCSFLFLNYKMALEQLHYDGLPGKSQANNIQTRTVDSDFSFHPTGMSFVTGRKPEHQEEI